MYITSVETETAEAVSEYAARIHYYGARPASMEETKRTRPYFVRLKFSYFDKDSRNTLFEMAKKLVKHCSVVIGNEGLDVEFESREVADIFAKKLSVA